MDKYRKFPDKLNKSAPVHTLQNVRESRQGT